MFLFFFNIAAFVQKIQTNILMYIPKPHTTPQCNCRKAYFDGFWTY